MLCRWASAGVGERVPLATALAALWVCVTGALEVQVPEDPVVALVGADATLRCSFSPEPDFSLAQLNLIWQLTDTKQLVHSFAEGRDQGSAYANRTALFPDLLAQGNASLRLQRVRVADEGSFTCFVSIRDFGSAAVSLQVAAPYSKPSMTLEPSKDLRPGDTVTITCSSYRGYPEAEVLWQDGQGAPLTGNVTTSQMANEQGLFDVRSVLRVVLGANGTYSCLVRNPVLRQDAHGSVTITPHRSPIGAVEVLVPEDPVVALVGADATLRCSFSPEPDFSLAQLNLIWQLTDTKQLVHSFAEGRDQGSAYANRTALFPDLLAQGNASLRLQRVRVADEGSFTCFVSIRDFGSAAVSLQVAAPYSKPSMTLEPSKDLRPGDTVTITCSSYRGYPEAEVLWQDGQGAPLTGNVTTSQMANEQGLFDVRSVLRVVLGANGTYSCLVRNPVLRQDAHGSVTITGAVLGIPRCFLPGLHGQVFLAPRLSRCPLPPPWVMGPFVCNVLSSSSANHAVWRERLLQMPVSLAGPLLPKVLLAVLPALTVPSADPAGCCCWPGHSWSAESRGEQCCLLLALRSPSFLPRTRRGPRDWAAGWQAQNSGWPRPRCGRLEPLPLPLRELTEGPSAFHGNIPLASLPLWGKPRTLTTAPSVPTPIYMRGSPSIFCKGWIVNILGFVGHIRSLLLLLLFLPLLLLLFLFW
ncbi:CD276 antigen isoform X1 [Meles meles]|uniref:CD276 antigen isoform X1 n=1 Tax=Meles meles TaxID=9662 RepID=UPI001E69B77D|nr:CD276 antigen isoform X1 [Meles meles]XP_045865509.1 CD276 antigen isoform X1 [Meles meles]XP_045865510.1 CD276 antigen isoform X1 [Meles meles]XP_045865511.1 CD276 antigen isoform X1 [Meles meles]